MRTPESLPLGEPVADVLGSVPDRALGRAPHRGRWISLEPLDAARDAPDLYAGSHGTPENDALWTYMPYGPFESEKAMEDWLLGCADSSDPLFFAVVDNASSRRIGMTSFLNIEPEHRTIEVGHIWYTPEFQRTRANTEAMRLMLGESFDRLRFRRVEWKCDALNERSRAAALRLGFRFEGIFRQHRVVKGRNRDTAWYAMLDSDWKAVKARLDEILDPRRG